MKHGKKKRHPHGNFRAAFTALEDFEYKVYREDVGELLEFSEGKTIEAQAQRVKKLFEDAGILSKRNEKRVKGRLKQVEQEAKRRTGKFFNDWCEDTLACRDSRINLHLTHMPVSGSSSAEIIIPFLGGIFDKVVLPPNVFVFEYRGCDGNITQHTINAPFNSQKDHAPNPQRGHGPRSCRRVQGLSREGSRGPR